MVAVRLLQDYDDPLALLRPDPVVKEIHPSCDARDARLARWRACWHVVLDPAPGVVAALPLRCLTKHGCAGLLQEYRSSPVADAEDGVHVVRWLGWSPSDGLVVVLADWSPWTGRPYPPATGWKPCQAPKARSVRQPDLVPFRCLPFPPGSGPAAECLAQEPDVRRAEEANHRGFVRFLPEGVARAVSILSEVSDVHDDDFQPSKDIRLEERLLFLLGAGLATTDAAEAGRRRTQFVLSHPAFSLMAMVPGMTRGIDAGQESIASIADAMKCPARLVRPLSRIDPARLSAASRFLGTACCLPLLEGMASSWLTGLAGLSDDGWEALAALSRCLDGQETDHPVPRRYGVSELRPDPRGSRAIGRLVGTSLAPDGTGRLDWIAATAALWAHFEDVVQDMAKELVLPAMARTWPTACVGVPVFQVLRQALLCLGLRKLHRIVLAHLAKTAHDTRMGLRVDLGGSSRWGELAPQVIAPSGMILRFLSSQDELDEEGRRLGHCVGSYGRRCMSRSCAILSLGRRTGRDGGRWKPSSTAEIVVRRRDGSSPRVAVRQHYGHGNDMPADRDAAALEWWLDAVETGRISIEPDALRPEPVGALVAENLPDLLGEGWMTPEAHAHRWDRWRRLLGTRTRSFGDWLLSLPTEFMAASPQNGTLAAQAVDMDLDMERARLVLIEKACLVSLPA